MTAFFVAGKPATKGSARAIKRGGYAVLVASSSNKNRDEQRAWATVVGQVARRHCAVSAMFGPIAVEVRFYLPRGSSVKRERPSVKPDIDKLLRATFDALTGIAWSDDAQVVEVTASKFYVAPGGEAGAWIRIQPAKVGEECAK